MKTCANCSIEKSHIEFNVKRYKSGHIGLRSYCKACDHKLRQEWRNSSPKDNERNKKYNMEHAHEIRGKKLQKYWPKLSWAGALEEWNRLFNNQNKTCAICRKVKKLLHVDHCHTTNITRGLLCYNCNNGLGRFKDNVTYLKDAISYLEKTRPE